MAISYYDTRLETSELNRWHHVCLKSIAPILAQRSGLRVGEFGCGSGAFLCLLRRNFPSHVYSGYDYSLENVKTVVASGISCQKLDFDKTPLVLGHETLDVVISLAVIEHLLYPLDFIRDLYRILAPSGSIALGTPNAFNLMRRIYFMAGQHRDPLMDPTKVAFAEHLRGFSYSMVERMAAMAGFIQSKRHGDRVYHGPGSLMSLINSEIIVTAAKGRPYEM